MWERRSLCMCIFVPLRVYHTERGIYSPYLSYRKSKSYVKGKVRNEGLAFLFLCSLPYRNESDNMHRRVTVNGKPYVEPTGDIGTFSEFVSHTAVQIEIEVAPKETAGVQYYPLLSILFRADHFFPYMVSKGYTLTLHNDTWIGYIPSAKGEITNYTRYVSGKIIFQGFSNGIVTLQLDNVTFADKNNQSNVITLNGTLDFEYSV